MLSARAGRNLSAAGALVLAACLFLTWYHVVRPGGGITSSSGFDTFPRLRIVLLVGAALTLATALPAQTGLLLTARTLLGLVVAVLILRRIIDPPEATGHVSSQLGVYVGLVGALAIAAGGLVDSGRVVVGGAPPGSLGGGWFPPALASGGDPPPAIDGTAVEIDTPHAANGAHEP